MQFSGRTSNDGRTSRSRAQSSSLWVRRANDNEVGDVRRTPLRYDLMHEDCKFELDVILHRQLVKLADYKSNVRPTVKTCSSVLQPLEWSCGRREEPGKNDVTI